MKLALVNRQVILPESGTESFQCHASTLVRLPCGTLVAAWFAGCAKEAKIQPSGYLAMNIISGQHRSEWRHARGSALESGVILPVG